MKRLFAIAALSVFAVNAGAGYKVKLIKPKKVEQFQTHASSGGTTFAADLLFDGGAQKKFFYKALSPSKIVAVRLLVRNGGTGAASLPVDAVRLVTPEGSVLPQLSPDTVARAVLQGLVVDTKPKENTAPVAVTPTMRTGDPRRDPTDPNYDPRIDPSDPSYDPNDPRTRTGGVYDNGPYMRPGIDVILNPGGGGGSGDLSQFEKQLVEKDFDDKAHTSEPVQPSLSRDRFLFFSVKEVPKSGSGFVLVIPGQGGSQKIELKF